MTMRVLVLMAAVAALMSGPALAQDAAAGATAFKLRCGVCHTVDSETSGAMGPSLKGVAGRNTATLADFNYSPALKAKGDSWTDANLDAFLTSPPSYAPGTRMFMAVGDPGDRANIIAYLKSVK
jgi:cytochrome c